jgi:hypothetical protein
VTRKEARDIIKNRTQTKYSNSVVLLLMKVLDLTYRKGQDDPGREIETTTANLMRAAGVKHRQIWNLIKQLGNDGVLVDVQHSFRKVSCRLNVEPLLLLEPYGDKLKAEKKQKDAERSRKAREQRAAQRAYIEFLIHRDQEQRRLVMESSL